MNHRFRQLSRHVLKKRNVEVTINMLNMFGRLCKAHGFSTTAKFYYSNIVGDALDFYVTKHTYKIINETVDEFMIEKEEIFGSDVLYNTIKIHSGLWQHNEFVHQLITELKEYKSQYSELLIKYGENNARLTTNRATKKQREFHS